MTLIANIKHIFFKLAIVMLKQGTNVLIAFEFMLNKTLQQRLNNRGTLGKSD